MPEQKGLKTWLLPNDLYPLLPGETPSTFRAVTVHLCLISVQKNKSFDRRSPCPSEMGQLSHGHFNAAKGVTRAWPEHFDHKMDGEVRFSDEILEKAGIALFRLTLAADEYGSPLRNKGAARSHPSFGTPPYTPLRYFR